MDNKILLVEDLVEFQNLVKVSLGYKYQVDVAETMSAARLKLKSNSYSLLILDVLLPDGSGMDLCREIQSDSQFQNIPIVFLTSKDSISDKVLGFSIGVDDYIVKPFDPAELSARVDVRIMKSLFKKQAIENFRKGPFRFELSGLRLFIQDSNDEKKIEITPIEFKILLKLAQNTNRVFSRQQILDSVWGHDVYIDDRSIDRHISAIRRKIEPHQKAINTVSGIGYEFKLL